MHLHPLSFFERLDSEIAHSLREVRRGKPDHTGMFIFPSRKYLREMVNASSKVGAKEVTQLRRRRNKEKTSALEMVSPWMKRDEISIDGTTTWGRPYTVKG